MESRYEIKEGEYPLRIRSFDYSLIAVILVVGIFGVVMVYSASMYTAVEVYGVRSDYFFIRQLIALVLGICAFLFFANFNYRMYKSNALQVPLVLVMISALIAVDQFGDVTNNSARWLEMGPISIQPSEFVKLMIILYMASVFHKKQGYINNFERSLAPPLIVLLGCVFLIVKQPDVGTASVILVISFFIILSSGMDWKRMAIIVSVVAFCVSGLITALIKYPDAILSETQKNRFIGFLQPFETEQEQGYQVVGSLLAIGSGEMTGVGFGNSTQKYGYIPEVHTDAIIAVIAEEFGFLGVAFLLFCLGFIVIKGILISIRCKDPFGSMIAIGISAMIGFQTFVNLGGMTSMLPITGVTLPLISYGGTSLLLTLISLGILVNISMQTERKRLMAELELD